MKRCIFSVTLAMVAALVVVCFLAGAAQAQQQGEPLRLTVIATRTYRGDGVFAVQGTGTGTIGDFTTSGIIQYTLNEGYEWFYASATTLLTEDGDELYVEQSGHSLNADAASHAAFGAQGTFRIVGGSGIYEGASGSGSFLVMRDAEGNQIAISVGTLLIPL